MPMIDNRGAVHLDAATILAPDDDLIVIEAYEESERRRVHDLMTEDWQLIGLARRRDGDGRAYTEYQLRAPRLLV